MRLLGKVRLGAPAPKGRLYLPPPGRYPPGQALGSQTRGKDMARQADTATAPRAAWAWRRWTANAAACAILLIVVAALWAPRRLNVAGRLSAPALLAPADDGVRTTLVRSLKILRMRAAEAEHAGLPAVEIVAPDGGTHTFSGLMDGGAFRDGFFPGWAAAVLGAFLAAATWNLGWVRRGVVLAAGLVLAPVLMVVFAGAFQAIALAAVGVRAHDLFWAWPLGARVGVFAALAATGLAWWAVQAVVTDEPDEALPAATAHAVSAPPLLWACALVAPALAAAAALDAAGITGDVPDLFRPPPVAAVLAVAGLVGGAALLAGALMRSDRCRRWAPLPLLLAAPAGAAAGVLLLAAALAVHDQRCRVYCRPPRRRGD